MNRDLDHFLVHELIRRRVETVVPASSAEDLDSGDIPDVYTLTLSIEQLEEAWRPRWNWGGSRYVDDDVLHLEVSVALAHGGDDASVGGLYDIHDYRAEDYGPFSQAQAVRAVVYEETSKLRVVPQTQLS